MEDTKSLLIMVLEKVFQNRPKIVEDTFQLIYNYNNGKKEKLEYEKTLKTICDLMNEELPSQILVYLLTMVDMPTEDGCQLPIMEKMQKTHNCLPESVRPHLVEYLKQATFVKIPATEATPAPMVEPEGDSIPEVASNKVEERNVTEIYYNPPEEMCLKPPKKPRLKKKNVKFPEIEEESCNSPKNLLDICANYVVQNERILKNTYKKTQEKAWKLINQNVLEGDDLQLCYNVVKDTNKKTKWLRMIENDNITSDIFVEEYKDSLVFIKEKHLQEPVESDLFELSGEMDSFFEKLVHAI